VQWSWGFISSRIKGKGKVFEVGDKRRMFLTRTPGLCSEELLLHEGVGEENVQPFSQMRMKGVCSNGLNGSENMEGSSP